MRLQSLRTVGWVIGAVIGIALLGGCEDQPPPPRLDLTVTTVADGADADPGDGICEATTGTGACTLRAAIDEANASAVPTWVTLPSGTFTLTPPGPGGDDATTGDLDVDATASLVISAPDGARIESSTDGVEVHTGNLLLNHIGIRSGGTGVSTAPGARTTLVFSSLTGNDGPGLVVPTGASAHLAISTVTGNGEGGALVDGSLVIDRSTITANDAGGIRGSGTAHARSSIIAAQATGADCAPTVALTSAGANLAGDGSCPLTAPSDLATADPDLGPATSGLVPGHVPPPSSPAVDHVPAGEAGCDGIDQLGTARPVGAGCDIGAVETDLGRHLVVDDAADAPDLVPGDGACTTAGGGCTLRAAVDETNTTPSAPTSGDTITLEVDPVLTRTAATTEDANATGDLDIAAADLTIDGAGHTVDAGGIDRVLDVRGAQLEVTRVTLRGGRTETTGGAIRASAGDLRVVDAWIDGNTADGGGGIDAASDTGSATIERTTLTGNAATGTFNGLPETRIYPGFGGAVLHRAGELDIVASTITDNSANSAGAGVLAGLATTRTGVRATTAVEEGGQPLVRWQLWRCDILGPCYPLEGGPFEVSGTAWSGECGRILESAPITSLGHNVTPDVGCTTTAPGDISGAELRLTPLAHHGGQGPTLLPWADSPLIDAVPSGTVGLCDGSVPTDQRGELRPGGSACDVGAIEGSNGAVPNPLALVVTSPLDARDTLAGDGACVATTGGCTLRAAIDEANAYPTDDTITIADGVDPVLRRAGTDEDHNATGDLDITQPLTIDGDGAMVEGAGIDRVVDGRLRFESDELRIVDLTIRGGSAIGTLAAGSGGGIRQVTGGLALDRAVVEENVAAVAGGGISIASRAEIDGSTIRANAAPGGAGLDTSGTTTIETTRVEDNIAVTSGGGLRSSGATTVRSSTVQDNETGLTGRGGGIDQAATGSLTVERSTVANNEAGTAAAIAAVAPGSATLVTSTITDNRSGTGAAVVGTVTGTALTLVGNAPVTPPLLGEIFDPAAAGFAGTGTFTASVFDNVGRECSGSMTSGGWNVVADRSCGDPVASDRAGIDPEVLARGDHGGPTTTRLLAGSSPALDLIPAGTAAICELGTTDQRGFARPDGAACDAGAVEGWGAPLEPRTFVVDTAGDDVDAVPGDGVCATATSACSLRAAVTEANRNPGPDTIQIADGVDPELTRLGTDDANDVGDLDSTDPLTVEGGGAVVRNTTGATAFEERDGTLTLRAVGITDTQTNGGLAVASFTGVTLEGTALVGAGLYVTADGVVRDSTIDRSEHNAITVTLRADLVVERSTIARSGATGLSINAGRIRIDASTISGNGTGAMLGGAESGVITRSTIVGNQGSLGAVAVDGSWTASGTVYDNPVPECGFGGVPSLGYNRTADASCNFAGPGDQVGPTALAPLRDEGGPTPTHVPLTGSPVVDAIPVGTAGLCDASTAIDQRGVARPAGAACDIGAVEGSVDPDGPLALVVDDATDAQDALPGDGACVTATGTCTLRAAIDETNAAPTADTITIAAGIDPTLSRSGRDEDLNRTGDLDVTGALTIEGGGATIDGARLDRVLHVRSTAVVTIRDLTVTGGQATHIGGPAPTGGGIGAAGQVHLVRVHVVGNEAGGNGSAGGGVAIGRAGSTITDSVIEGNAVLVSSGLNADGGGVWVGAGASATIRGTTFLGNEAYAGGAVGLAPTAGTTVVDSSTLWANRSRNGLSDAVNGPVRIARSTLVADVGSALPGGQRVTASIVAASDGPACAQAVTSEGRNLFGDTSCGAASSDRVGDPLVAAPADNGGPTPTALPAPNSPAVDAIPVGSGACTTTTPADQRGVARPQGPRCDIGAVEGSGTTPFTALSLVVTTGADGDDQAPGDGICATAGATCTLRAAISEANAWPADDTITIAAGLTVTLSIPGVDDDTNATGDLDVVGDLVIEGAGATVDGAQLDRVIDHHVGSLALRSITVTGGRAVPDGATGARYGQGGGIRVQGRSFELTASTVRGNRASGTASNASNSGGGIFLDRPFNRLTNTATISRSTITANVAEGFGGRGGGLDTDYPGVAIDRSTFSANRAFSGAALTGTSAMLRASTVAANVGQSSLDATITAGSSVLTHLAGSGQVCTGALHVSEGANVASDATCALVTASDQQGVDPLLGPLADNGGPTLTHLPLAGSPALDRTATGSGTCTAALPVDQRGSARPIGAGCDAGSVERP